MQLNKKIHTINDNEIPIANKISIVVAVPETHSVQGQASIRRNQNDKIYFVFVFKILLIWFCILFVLFLLIIFIRKI